MAYDGEFVVTYETPVDIQQVNAIKSIAKSISSGSKGISKSLSDVANSLRGIELLASIFDSGISKIADENRAVRILNEYYTGLDRLLLLKEKHPNIMIEISENDISNLFISLSDEMLVTLSFCFTYSEDKVFELFKLECESGKCKPQDWLYTFYCRSDNRFRFVDEKFCLNWNNYSLICRGGILKDFLWGPLEDFISYVYKLYSESYNWFYIAEGAKKVNTWITEKNCIIVADYLKKIYSDIVINQLLNSK